MKSLIISGICFTICLSGMFTTSAQAAFDLHYNLESVLMDKAYKSIYNDIYEVTDSTKEKELDGQDVAEYACEFIGNPYVWGGTSLTNGADCSGFVQSVYGHFGIELPRTSSAQQRAGKSIEYKNIRPGDIICYEGHVGIYIGNQQIVNARNPEEGIGITSATYTKILAVRRII